MTPAHRPVRIIASIATVLAIALTFAAPQRAEAWGERQAVRSCGTNWISSSSWRGGGTATTQRLRGTCGGYLYAGLRDGTGYATWGPRDANYAIAKYPGHWVGGTHRGCDACASSFT